MKAVSIEKTILNVAEAHDVIGKSLSLAVSGGPDSMAMAHALIENQKEMASDIEILHFNHQIRGAAAKSDSVFVQTYFDSLGIPTYASEKNVVELSRKNKISIEDAARLARYEFFASHIHEKDNKSILILGHNFEDQVETILMHIIRGSGLNGLQGMAEMSHQTIGTLSLNIFRPMLSLNRSSILKYCSDNNIPWRSDQTNTSTEYTRNSIRLELLPFLEKYNPGIFKSINKLGHSAKRDYEYINAKVDELWSSLVTIMDEGIRIQINPFNKLHPSLKWRILQRAAHVAIGDRQNLFYKHVESMLDITEGATGRSLNLPAGIVVMKEYEELVIFKTTDSPSKITSLNDTTLIQTPGTTLTEQWKISASLESVPDFSHTESMQKGILSTSLNINLSNGPLWVRYRNPGDVFQPSGMTNSKKLQDFMVDSKIPRRDRDSIPLIVSSKGIAAVVGWRTADWATPSKYDHSLQITFNPRTY